jgi:DmsE family decaheme c-type cytochrome
MRLGAGRGIAFGAFATLLAVAFGTAADDSGTVPAAAPDAPPADAYVGEAACRGCHAVEAEHWDDTLHASLFHQNPRNALERRTCEACHGPGRAHLEDPQDRTRIVAFTRESGHPVDEQNRMCLQCHAGGARLHWPGSAHDAAELACSDCHNPMSRTSERGLLRKATEHETCFACHPAQRAEFRKRSHMPLFEGKLSCTDCHQPHGSVAEPLLAADDVNHVCYSCHADKRGPFLFEHAPVAESCLNCHRPHGSNRESLLASPVPFLCHQCHSQSSFGDHAATVIGARNLGSGANPDDRILNRGCVNCHSRIHGSNHPSGARFHR